MRIRRWLLMALGALFLGGVTYGALVLGIGPGSRNGSAFAAATCSVALDTSDSNYTATVTLDTSSPTTTLGADSSGNLLVDGTPCSGQSSSENLTSTDYIAAIDFAGAGNSQQSVVLDMTQPGGVFPCHTEIEGNLFGETLQVNAAASEHVTVGTTGVNLGNTSGGTCASGSIGTLTGIGPYELVGGTGSNTVLDAGGGTGTGSGVVARFVAGDSSETFDLGAPGSILDFSQLSCPSSPSNPCSITMNSTGSTVNGVSKFNAALFYGASPQQSYTDIFTTNEADFTEVDGNSAIPTAWYAPPSSTTTYQLDGNVALQGSSGNYNVSSSGSGNQVNAGSGSESFGVAGSNVVMNGGTGTGSNSDTFTATGSNNTFVAGPLADNFFDSGAGNTVSFANISTSTNALTIDADSNNSSGFDSAAGTATVGSVKYTFLNNVGFTTTPGAGADSDFTTFLGATTGNTTFQADSAGGLTFQGAGTGNTADFSQAGTGVTVNLSGAQVTTPNNTAVQTGQVLVTSGTSTPAPTAAYDSIADVSTVKGSKSGSNTFYGGSGSASFVAKSSSNNTVNGAAGGTYQVDMSGSGLTGNAVNAGGGTESFTVTGNGITMTGGTSTGAGSDTFTDASGTGNHFIPGSLPDFFYDGGTANTVDFSGVGTSPQDQLAINVAGSPEAVTLTTSGGATPVTIQNGQAEVGTGTVYTFLNSATATGTGAASDFTTLTGPTSGNTQFLGGSEFASGGPGKLTFQGGSGGGNSLAFPTVNTGITVNLQNGPSSPGQAYASGFSTTPDTLTGITTVTGSPGGGNSFTAGGPFVLGSSTVYNFIGNGNGNTFTGGAGTDIFTSNGNGNVFQAGTGPGTFNDPTGTGNTVDFSPLTSAAVTVNVTGGPVGSLGSTDEATATLASGTTKYFFSGFGADDATFIGASGTSSQTTFLAGSSGDTFDGGQGGALTDTLSFADATGNSLQICTVAVTGTCTSGQAILGKVAENFNPGIKVFDGLGTGDTTFAAGDSQGGFSFYGAESGNTADFSNAADSIKANLVSGQVTFSSGTSPGDTISDVSTVYGSSRGGNTFVAANASETFGDQAVGTPVNGADSIDFSNLQTVPLTPLTVNANGGGTSPYTATFGGNNYQFVTGGQNFTKFTGAGGGFTTFVAGNTPNYSFTGLGGGNSIDYSADASPIVANLFTGAVSLNPGTDSISGIATVTGSPNGGNTFVAGTGQNETFKGGTSNTVDLSDLTTAAVVNVSQSGQAPQSTGFGTATSGGTIYDFTAFDTAKTTFKGSKAAAGTTFYAGSAADTFIGESAADTLSFADAQGSSLSICQAASAIAGCSAGQALLGNTTESFQSIKTFDGLATQGSATIFYADDSVGGKVFAGQAGTNTADFTAAGSGITADMTKSTSNITLAGVPADTVTGTNTVYGSENGGNRFIASPSGSEVFGDLGSAATDSIDFSHILGTTSANPLVVDASLSTTATGVAPFTAQFGNLTYSFATGGPDFTGFTGSDSGNTTFQAAATSTGLSFTGNNTGNTADFSLSSGITADMVTDSVTLSGVTGADTLNGSFARVVGAPSGNNTFDGALTGTQFTAAGSPNTVSYADQPNAVTFNLPASEISAGSGTPDTFSFPTSGKLTVEGSAGTDDFVVGTRAVTIEGGGGQDSVDLSQTPAPTSGSTGATISLNLHGSIASSTIGGVTFTSGCSSAADLCVTSLTGTPYNDTFIAGSTLDPSNQLTLKSGGGTDTLNLQSLGSPAVVDMPIPTNTPLANPGTCLATAVPAGDGAVCSAAAQTPGILFSGIETVVGSSVGGDDFFAGQGSQNITETGNPGTLDSSVVPAPSDASDTIAGISIYASQGAGGSFTGTVSSSLAIGETVTFNNIGTFVGTQDNDTFTQAGSGPITSNGPPAIGYVFDGKGGNNSVDLSSASTGAVSLTAPSVSDGCSTPPGGSGIPNPNDVSDTISGVTEMFSCVGSVISSSSIYTVSPGQTASINGGGSGTIVLSSSSTCGVTVTMPVGVAAGRIDSNGCSDYHFSFTGVSTVIGTPYNDLFIPGSGNASFQSLGNNSSVSFATAAGPAVVNLSSSPYTIPAGYSNSGTVVPADTAIGGNGGTVTMQGVSSAIASAHGDILVGGPGVGSLIGGSGNDRFVPTGGVYTVNGGQGTNTIDLSALSGYTSLDLGSSAPQQLGTGDGSVQIVGASVQTAIASPAGSALQAGNGDGYTLVGSGNDWLAAGIGTQTLIGNGSGDTLVAGIGTDTMQGGSAPVVFEPGQGTDNLSSQTTGNTLSYSGQPNAVTVNLSDQLYSVPAGEPGAGATLSPNTAAGGYGATVNLSGAGISRVIGSAANDIFVTGSGGENINGGGGNDLFVINSGNNTLTAGTNTDSRFLIDGSGNNVLQGGGLSWIDYSQAPAGVTVNLLNNTASGGWSGASEQLSGVLNIAGSKFNDVLIAGQAFATVDGDGGSDLLQVSPAGGDLLESGGSGNDTFCAQVGCNNMSYNPAAGSTMIGGSGADTFYARNGVADTIDGGAGFNQAQVDLIDKTTNITQFLP